MKTIVAGSRHCSDYSIFLKAIQQVPWTITEIVSGGAKGIDRLGELYADYKELPLKIFPANWNLHGKAAGFKRNVEMANYAEAVVAIWDGISPGTKHMIKIANDKGLQVYVYRIA